MQQVQHLRTLAPAALSLTCIMVLQVRMLAFVLALPFYTC